MKHIYFFEDGKSSTFPTSREDALLYKTRFYTSDTPCDANHHHNKRYVINNACHACLVDVGQMIKAAIKGDVDWSNFPQPIINAIDLVIHNNCHVANEPCGYGHLPIRTNTNHCHYCLENRQARQTAEQTGETFYKCNNPCRKCGQRSRRRVKTGSCENCEKQRHSVKSDIQNMMNKSPDLILERKDAKTMGIMVYRTGKPCIHGHYGFRYTSTGGCIDCLKGF